MQERPHRIQVGIKSGCENGISFYFLGFAFIILGVITLSLSLFTMRRHRGLAQGDSKLIDTTALDERYRNQDFRERGE